MAASTDSNFGAQYNLPGTYAPSASFELVKKAYDIAKEKGIDAKVGNILSSDVFYSDNGMESLKIWSKMNILAVEMEAAALYMNAARAGVNALCMLTISDLPFEGVATTAMERQTAFTKMMEVALELA